MAYLMMLAFLIDQIQQRCCGLFQDALKKAKRKSYFWEKGARAVPSLSDTGLGNAVPLYCLWHAANGAYSQ